MVCGGGKGGELVVDGSGSMSLAAAGSGGARIDLLGIKGVADTVGAAVAVVGAAVAVAIGAAVAIPGVVIVAADALFVISGRATDAAG